MREWDLVLDAIENCTSKRSLPQASGELQKVCMNNSENGA
jgi:hypothetical protein